MRNRIEYFIKYSVAPPPSRDYYGLKIFEDEVILYLWRISHGPHKTPIVYRAKLTEFDQEKFLHNEIHRGFGKYLLKYVNNIAKGNKNTLLTLPKSLIEKISKYLDFTDIIKLSLLSHVAYE
ncbi:PREDICTED: F-box only protein 36-like, partial [Wasmannia auropunctata]|uniref:F-box only protein 36-like n=1 Tax=Wasmannia auropunctata TaxID=64793 RepID=UPI0005F0685F